MTLVLMTWLWSTGVSALVLLTLMAVQRLAIGPAGAPRRVQSPVLVVLPRPVRSEVREPQAA